MHRCLQVPEIVDIILKFVPPETSATSARIHLVSSALSCRLFSEVALNIIWHTQSNLVALLKTLPCERWREEGTNFDLEFEVDIPTTSEWKRLRLYASRIRRIEYLPHPFHRTALWNVPRQLAGNFPKEIAYDLRELHKLSSAVDFDVLCPLFPSLLQLEFTRLMDAIPCLHIFLRTKDVSLSLHWGDIDPNTGSSIMKLFSVIAQQALHMQNLDLGSFGDLVTVMECRELSDLVQKMKELRGLACGSRKLTSDALQCLATLPDLQLPNSSNDILTSTRDISRPIFSSLQHLTMRENDLYSFSCLLERIPYLRLQSLTLFFSVVPDPVHIHTAFHNFLRQAEDHRTFRQIVFKSSSNQTVIRGQGDPLQFAKTVSAELLKPILAFRNLTHLNLDVPWKFNLADHDVEAMANAWPRLRFLRLGSMQGWGSPHLVTAKGLLALTKGCREIQHLTLAFDATLQPPVLIPLTILQDYANTRINYLYVGDSPIDERTIVPYATFLVHIFPNLAGIGGSWLSQSNLVVKSGWRDWAKVTEMIRSQ